MSYEKELEAKIHKQSTDIEAYQEVVDDLISTMTEAKNDLSSYYLRLDKSLSDVDEWLMSERKNGSVGDTEYNAFSHLNSFVATVGHIIDLLENKLDDYGYNDHVK